MAITKVNTSQLRFNDPSGVIFIPYVNDVLSNDGYDIHDIVGDTFNLSQDDADKTEIPWEFGDTPLDENVTLGTRNVTMECLDFQNAIMKNLFGWNTDVNGFSVAPAQYQDLYCCIILQFNDKHKNVIMPYVKMESKTVFENLHSDIARGTLGGTLLTKGITPSGETDEMQTALMFVDDNSAFDIGDATVSISSAGVVSISGGAGSDVLTTMNFTYNDSAKTYTASDATGTVTVEESAGWLSTSVASKTITITPQTNYSTVSRSANITVYDGDTVMGIIKVVQAGQAS